MKNLKGTKTEQNLKDAFAGESQANRRYLYFAKVADIVRRINYGTVVLVIQDGKVVQIEMAEKFRLR